VTGLPPTGGRRDRLAVTCQAGAHEHRAAGRRGCGGSGFGPRGRRDAERLARLLHEGFRWISHTGETYSRSEYVRRNTEGHKVWCSQRLSGVEVVIVGDTAVLHAEVTDEVLGENDEPETFRMPMTQVWVRQDDVWMCLAGHAGPRRS
jgi:hypothetical protein